MTLHVLPTLLSVALVAVTAGAASNPHTDAACQFKTDLPPTVVSSALACMRRRLGRLHAAALAFEPGRERHPLRPAAAPGHAWRPHGRSTDDRTTESDSTDEKFLSALQNDDLVMLILEFALYRQQAKKVLTAAHGLAHFNIPKKFEPEGVRVIDAGSQQMNGFYVRRENSEGPPDPSLYGGDESDDLTPEDRERWLKSVGRQWYQKEDVGSYITFDKTSFGWASDDPDLQIFF